MYICSNINRIHSIRYMKNYQEDSITKAANPQFPRVLNRSIHQFESVIAKRIFYCVQSQIRKSMKDINLDDYKNLWFEIPTFFIDSASRMKQIEKATDELQKAKFKFLDPQQERFSKIVPFPVVQYDKRWGHVKVKVEEEALPFLVELSKGYYWLQLRSALLLSSKYSQRWYELLSEKKDIGKVSFSIDEIKVLLDVEGNYEGNLLNRIIYTPIREINKKTELFIEYTPINNQRKPILGFDFTLSNQEQKGEAAIYQKIGDYYDKLQKMSPQEKSAYYQRLLKEYSFSEKEFNQYTSDNRIMSAIIEADSKIQSGKVKINGTKGQYMGGVIKKAKLKKQEEREENNPLPALPFTEETPNAKLRLPYGSEKTLRTYAESRQQTIEELIKELNLEKGENDLYYRTLT